jgi:glucokinase
VTAFVGVDVGGTKVAAAAFADGRLSESVVRPTVRASAAALIDELVELVEAVRPHDAAAVGIGVPSVVEFATGRIRYSVNIPLADLPLRHMLSERIGLPVFVENDASCAALAEALDGDSMACQNLVMFTVGTGVGGGLVLNGRLYRGATGAAPEMGHVIVGMDLRNGPPPPLHRPPQHGSLERLAAGTELDRLARRTAERFPDSALGRILTERSGVIGRDAVDAAKAGDAPAADCVRLLGRRLGIGVANAINMFDPDEVVIGGGVSAAGDLLLEPIREVAAQYVLPGVGTQTTIRLARRGPEAGLLGAAQLARMELEPEEAPES